MALKKSLFSVNGFLFRKCTHKSSFFVIIGDSYKLFHFKVADMSY